MPLNEKELEAIFKEQAIGNTLDLSGMDVDEGIAESLVSFLQKNSQITSLNLSSTQTGNQVAKALSTLPWLCDLDVSYTLIGREGFRDLAHGSIATLKAIGCKSLKNGGIDVLLESSHLTDLDASECDLTDPDARSILRSNTLQTLVLDTNNVTHLGLVDIPRNRILTKLSLAYNHVGDEGAILIAQCAPLKIVDLNGNNVRDKGASAFKNSNVVSLELAQNAVTGQGFFALCESRTLEKLSLFNNGMSFEGLTELPCNQTLKVLYLNFNKINSSPLKPLEDLLSFPLLENLMLAKNNIDQSTAEHLHSKVTPESHPYLTRIDLTGNPITDTSIITYGYDLKRPRPVAVVDDTPPSFTKRAKTSFK